MFSAAICTIFCKYPTPFGPFTLWNLFVVFVVPSPNCPLLLYPVAQTVPSFLNINVWFAPAATSIASVISSSFVVPSSSVISAFTCVGSVLFWLSPNPNSPFALYPQVYTSPFPFNAIK